VIEVVLRNGRVLRLPDGVAPVEFIFGWAIWSYPPGVGRLAELSGL
jgi:hypothetical protein